MILNICQRRIIYINALGGSFVDRVEPADMLLDFTFDTLDDTGFKTPILY
jgi:hypothetical protein